MTDLDVTDPRGGQARALLEADSWEEARERIDDVPRWRCEDCGAETFSRSFACGECGSEEFARIVPSDEQGGEDGGGV